MSKYDIVFTDQSSLVVEIEEDAKAPKLVILNGNMRVDNLPEGYSIRPDKVLYIRPHRNNAPVG